MLSSEQLLQAAEQLAAQSDPQSLRTGLVQALMQSAASDGGSKLSEVWLYAPDYMGRKLLCLAHCRASSSAPKAPRLFATPEFSLAPEQRLFALQSLQQTPSGEVWRAEETKSGKQLASLLSVHPSRLIALIPRSENAPDKSSSLVVFCALDSASAEYAPLNQLTGKLEALLRLYGLFLPLIQQQQSEQVLATQKRAVERRAQMANRQADQLDALLAERIIGQSAAIRSLRAQVKTVARTNDNLLILGAAGAGKTLLATTIHSWSRQLIGGHSKRRSLTIPTGELTCWFDPARIDRTIATIQLDGIDRLNANDQSALLDQLQRFEAAFAETPEVRPRLIGSASQQIDDLLTTGAFNRELYDRLAHLTLTLPPLSERREDIAIIANALLQRILQDRAGTQTPTEFAPEALETLETLDLPGNVRELKNLVRRAALAEHTRDGLLVLAPNSGGSVETLNSTQDVLTGSLSSLKALGLKEFLQRYEATLLESLDQSFNGDRAELASFLQLPRRTLSHKLKTLCRAEADGESEALPYSPTAKAKAKAIPIPTLQPAPMPVHSTRPTGIQNAE